VAAGPAAAPQRTDTIASRGWKEDDAYTLYMGDAHFDCSKGSSRFIRRARMKRRSDTLWAVTGAILTLAFVLWIPPRSYAQSNPTSPVDVVNALAAAQNANDPAAMRALVAPEARIEQPAGIPGPSTQTRDEFIAANTGASNSNVTVSNVQETAPGTVGADAVLSGGDIPALPHPFSLHVTFTVAGGLITHAVIALAPQTQQDLAALGPAPGMPSTGAGAPGRTFELGVIGLLCLLAGALTRRAGRAVRRQE